MVVKCGLNALNDICLSEVFHYDICWVHIYETVPAANVEAVDRARKA